MKTVIKILCLVSALNAFAAERVEIYSINGKASSPHPAVIDVRSGEAVLLRADVLDIGESCPHPEGCPQGVDADRLSWRVEPAGAGVFQPQGNQMLFRVPTDFESDITLKVSSFNAAGFDTLVLHNAERARATVETTEPVVREYYYEPRYYSAPYPYWPHYYWYRPYHHHRWYRHW